MDVAGAIGISGLTVCVVLGALVAVSAILISGTRTFATLGLASVPPEGAETTLSRAIEGAGVRTILMMLTGVAAAAGIRLSAATWTRIAGAVGAWVFVVLASALMAMTALRLAILPSPVPWLEASLNTLFGLALIAFGVALAWLSRHGHICGRFIYPLIAIFFAQVIVLVAQQGLRFDGAFVLNLIFALIVSAVIAALALLGRSQKLMRT